MTLIHHWRCKMVGEYGSYFQPVPWATWRGRGFRRGKRKMCFQNAWNYALSHDDLMYAEGFAGASGVGLVHHAWCIDDAGRVVEPTWRETDHASHPVGEWFYTGIPFETAWLARLTTEQDYFGVLFDENRDRVQKYVRQRQIG